MHVTLKLCWVFVYVWSRWTAQISLKHSEFSLGFFLLLEFWPLFFFFSLGSQQTIPLILFCFCNSWHVMYARVCLDVCICDLALSRVKSSQPKPRRGSELLIRALVWEHLRWFQTLMLFVVQRRLSPPFPVLPSVPLHLGLRRCRASFTSERLFHFVDGNEPSAEFYCQRCTSWSEIQSVRRVWMDIMLLGCEGVDWDFHWKWSQCSGNGREREYFTILSI